MFKISVGGSLFYDPRLPNYAISNGVIESAVNSAGSFTFAFPNDHPCSGSISRMKDVVEVTDNGVPIFRGRILNDAQDWNKIHSCVCEGLLACLNDSVVPPYDFPADYESDAGYQAATNVVEFWLDKLLAAHNASVDSWQQIHLGTVTVSDPNNYISRSCEDYTTTWQVLSEKLFGSKLGGYMVIRYEADGNYLDYLENFQYTNQQNIEYSVNLLDLTEDVKGEDFFSQIVPIGKDGLTIAELPDGAVSGYDDLFKSGNMIYSTSKRLLCGKVTKIVEFDDVTTDTYLRSAAAKALNESNMPATITVSAVDLQAAEGTAQGIRVGRFCNVISAPHGINATYPLITLHTDILHPEQTKVTLTKESRNLTSSIGDIGSAANTARRGVVQNNVRLNESISSVENNFLNQLSLITQDIDSLRSLVETDYVTQSGLSETESRLSSEIAQSATDVTISIRNEFTTAITDSTGDIKQSVDTLNEWFTFTTNGLTIGKSTTPVKLVLDANNVKFVDGNGNVLLYIRPNEFFMDTLKKFVLGNLKIFVLDSGATGFSKEV